VIPVITEILLGGKKIRLNPKKSIGKGGEADVYDIGNNLALKIFKAPDHPDFVGNSDEQKFAAERIQEHQQKLRQFPSNLPAGVITPSELAYNLAQNLIVGYAMKHVAGAELLIHFSERSFREKGTSNEKMLTILRHLHKLVPAIHQSKAVIGDFNDLNVLVIGDQVFLIDADSFQFGKFPCRTFTDRFVDPLLCDPRENQLVLAKAHNIESDWYAFAIMLMQCLLFVGPYGGVYRPKDPRQMVPHQLRPLRHITVFHPEVRYPKPAIPFKVLPDDLLHYFYEVFEKDRRGIFPDKLLGNLRFTTCSTCHTEHARAICPACSQAAPAAVKEVVTIRGEVRSTRIFKTRGVILYATYQEKKLRWLYHEGNRYFRENGQSVLDGQLDSRMRFRISRDKTLFGKDGRVATLAKNRPPEFLAVDEFKNLPIFDANHSGRYWLQSGQLFRDGEFGPKYIGDVLQGQALFWTGPQFGFGFYRAGNFTSAFVFDSKRSGIKDISKFPLPKGQLIDTTCAFSDEYGWFLISTQDGGRVVHRCILLDISGNILAETQVNQGDGTWLGSLRGKCAAGKFLFSATDDGIIRLEANAGSIVATQEFPDTEPFVNAGCYLFAGTEGIYVVDRQEIRLLKIG
jgi:tRNA A-37 threonylcarbamoyl transferase component Bud32